jgi:predicted membrane channel-forming protein YqfA (hemolysin III family)
MFVLMGMSAVFPVLHGLKLHGFHQMRERIGLTWMLLQGFLYILGAGLYAVSNIYGHNRLRTNSNRPVGQNDLLQELSIYGEVHTRSSTF